MRWMQDVCSFSIDLDAEMRSPAQCDQPDPQVLRIRDIQHAPERALVKTAYDEGDAEVRQVPLTRSGD
jgi:hypothetical protein